VTCAIVDNMTETRVTFDPRAGRAWAYVGSLLGVSTSIAANIAHTDVLPGDAPVGSYMLAAFWPSALYLAIEVFARTRADHGTWWKRARRWGLGLVAIVSAAISYLHLRGLMLSYGESTFSATIGPLAIDGLMTVCTGALIATAPHAKAARESRKAKRAERKLRREAREGKVVESETLPILPTLDSLPSRSAGESLPMPVETVEPREVETVSIPRVSRPLSVATPLSRLEQAQAVREMFSDWESRIVSGPEVTAATGIRGSESVEKIKDVLYPEAERTLKRAAAAASRAAVKAGIREEVSA
jgi:hypothetical protein